MNWFINDHDEITIYITDGWREFFVPKFRTAMTVEEPYLFLHWNDRERGDGGDERMLQIDYLDVVSGYGGYLSGASSAAQLKEALEAMILSGWTALLALIAQTNFTVLNEIPSGAINGINTVYTTLQSFDSGTVQVYLKSGGVGNYVFLDPGTDFTETGLDEITLTTPPPASSKIRVNYTY